MRKFTCPPNVETIGANILSYIKNMEDHSTPFYVEQSGLTDVQPDEWYPTQQLLNVFNMMVAEGKASSIIAIGLSIAANLQYPPERENAPLGDILAGWPEVYLQNHRGEGAGELQTEKLGDNHWIVRLVDFIFPDDVTYGVAYGFCKRFLPRGTQFLVEYESITDRRDFGGEETIIHITWDV